VSSAKFMRRHRDRRANRRRQTYSCEALEPRLLLAAVSWDAGAGDGLWNSAANWSNDAVPTAADDVTIDLAGTYTVTLSGTAASINSLSLGGASGTQTLAVSTGVSLAAPSTISANGAFAQSSGTLGGAGDVTITGTFNWTGGMMSGSGKTIIASGGTLNLSGGGTLSRVLQNDGTASWTGGGYNFSGGTFNNNGSFTVNLSSSPSVQSFGGTSAFNNVGTFTKQGTGTATFSSFSGTMAFNNSATGTVDVQAGTLQLSSGGEQQQRHRRLGNGDAPAQQQLHAQRRLEPDRRRYDRVHQRHA
jgi:hypothetical protein